MAVEMPPLPFPRPAQPRSQCRGVFFAGVAIAMETAILSTSMFVATSWTEQRLGKEGGSSTPSKRSILATAARRLCPSQSAAVANTIEPLASLISIQYRRVFRMCEVKVKAGSESKQTRVSGEGLSAVTRWPRQPLAS